MNQTACANLITTVADSCSRVLQLVHGLSGRQAAFKPTSIAGHPQQQTAICIGRFNQASTPWKVGRVELVKCFPARSCDL